MLPKFALGFFKILTKLVTSWKLTENFPKLSKNCLSRSHPWFVYIQFLITISSPWTKWSKVPAATNRATCLRGCCHLSHQLSIDKSEATARNSSPNAQYGWNMSCLTETKKHSLLQSAAHRGVPSMPRGALAYLFFWCIPSFTFDL